MPGLLKVQKTLRIDDSGPDPVGLYEYAISSKVSIGK